MIDAFVYKKRKNGNDVIYFTDRYHPIKINPKSIMTIEKLCAGFMDDSSDTGWDLSTVDVCIVELWDHRKMIVWKSDLEEANIYT